MAGLQGFFSVERWLLGVGFVDDDDRKVAETLEELMLGANATFFLYSRNEKHLLT